MGVGPGGHVGVGPGGHVGVGPGGHVGVGPGGHVGVGPGGHVGVGHNMYLIGIHPPSVHLGPTPFCPPDIIYKVNAPGFSHCGLS